eukprot:746672-Hanusia_phi.AAC.2
MRLGWEEQGWEREAVQPREGEGGERGIKDHQEETRGEDTIGTSITQFIHSLCAFVTEQYFEPDGDFFCQEWKTNLKHE